MTVPTARVRRMVIARDALSNANSRLDRETIRTAPKKHSTASRGLTLNQGLFDWRATVNGTRICSVGDCGNPPRSSRQPLCEMHYYRVRRNGTTGLKDRTDYKPRSGTHRPPVPRQPCSVEGCARDALLRAGDLPACRAHYGRWHRTGDVQAEVPLLTPRLHRGTCIVDECERIDEGSRGYCTMHVLRLQRHGTLHTVPVADRNLARGDRNHNWTGEDASYGAVHQRIRKLLGSARNRKCADCGERAQHWSYNHDDPYEVVAPEGPYSLAPAHYSARCVRCHKTFDMAVLRGKR